MKTCSKCLKGKSFDEFSIRGDNPDVLLAAAAYLLSSRDAAKENAV